MDQHYAIKQKVKVLGHAFVSAIVNVVTTFIAAFLQFIIAYHNAPGIKEDQRKKVKPRSSILALDKDAKVTLSIGGILYTTQLTNLISIRDTKLGTLLFSTPPSKTGFDDPIFIDRDGTHFRHVLNHLRGCDSISHVSDPQILDDLMEECTFYQLYQLIDRLEEQKQKLALHATQIKE